MFAAGFTSAITSPLASALTSRSIFEKKNPDGTTKNANSFQWVAYVVLTVGIVLGYLQIKPVPAIVAAQAFNGLILPFVSIFLFMVVNDKRVMGREHLNGWFSNVMMIIVTWVTLVLGIVNVSKAFATITEMSFAPDQLFAFAGLVALVITFFITIRIFRKRKKSLLEPDIEEKKTE